MTFDDPCNGGVGKLESKEVDTEDMGLVEQVSSGESIVLSSGWVLRKRKDNRDMHVFQ